MHYRFHELNQLYVFQVDTLHTTGNGNDPNYDSAYDFFECTTLSDSLGTASGDIFAFCRVHFTSSMIYQRGKRFALRHKNRHMSRTLVSYDRYEIPK